PPHGLCPRGGGGPAGPAARPDCSSSPMGRWRTCRSRRCARPDQVSTWPSDTSCSTCRREPRWRCSAAGPAALPVTAPRLGPAWPWRRCPAASSGASRRSTPSPARRGGRDWSGAEPASPGGVRPSRVEGHEIPDLRIASPLVFLSGCETGLGSAWSTSFEAGEDFVTLAQAFLYAGAENVVATLWRVQDEAAARFAGAYYAALRTGDPAAALAR